MPAYRMKHIPSGLYYCPSRVMRTVVTDSSGNPTKRIRWGKSNLSKKGKAYLSKPSFKWIGGNFYDHRIPRTIFDTRRKDKTSPFIPADWIIEEVA